MLSEGPRLTLTHAGTDDADAIAGIINRAFAVEQWFVEGDRTTPAEVRALMASPTGVFFIATEDGTVSGCVYAEQRSELRGYIGLLAVEASRSRLGIGPRLMVKAEDYLADVGCRVLDITVVNLRRELFPFYERLGYRTGETLPFPRPSTQPCHLVTMSKKLG